MQISALSGAVRWRRRRTAATSVVALCLVAVVGCSDGSGSEPASSGTSESTTSSAGPTPGAGPSSGDSEAGDAPEAGEAPETSPASGSQTPKPRETDPNRTDDGEPGEPDRQGRQGDVFDRIPGVDGAGCVTVGDLRDARSGGFVAGAFDDARNAYGTVRAGFGKRDIRLYFVPMHAATMPGVRIRASGPGGARGDVVRTNQGDTDAWKFYDSTIRLPQGGEWTFRVTAGRDRGCFTTTI